MAERVVVYEIKKWAIYHATLGKHCCTISKKRYFFNLLEQLASLKCCYNRPKILNPAVRVLFGETQMCSVKLRESFHQGTRNIQKVIFAPLEKEKESVQKL